MQDYVDRLTADSECWYETLKILAGMKYTLSISKSSPLDLNRFADRVARECAEYYQESEDKLADAIADLDREQLSVFDPIEKGC